MDHTFRIKGVTGEINEYFGTDTVDESSPVYLALDCANDLIDKFREYYQLSYKREIPRPMLFVIDRRPVNAFAVYERKLGKYCIGIFLGTINRIRDKTEEIVDMVIQRSCYIPEKEKLIQECDREKWVNYVYVNAIRFFVAHEYAHVLNGHVTMDEKVQFEFIDSVCSSEHNVYSQMKEFAADETAMEILCYMNRCSWESGYHETEYKANQALASNGRRLKEAGIPEVLINIDAQRYIKNIQQAFELKTLNIRQHLKYLMLGVNIVFLALDENRERKVEYLANQHNIPDSERSGFFYASGLRFIREVDHPICHSAPPMRKKCAMICESKQIMASVNYLYQKGN